MKSPLREMYGFPPGNVLIVGAPEAYGVSGPKVAPEVLKEELRKASMVGTFYHVANTAISAVYGSENYIGNYPREVYDVDGVYPGDEKVVENYTHWLFGQMGIELVENFS